MSKTICPRKLYKYQPFDKHSLINLIQNQLYFSKPENFNDPYDCDPPFEMSEEGCTEESINALYSKVRNWADNQDVFDKTYSANGKPNVRFERKYVRGTEPIKEQIRKKTGVTCFSKEVDNMLLWSHYADSHKGFCLEFDTQNPVFSGEKNTNCYKVKYPKSKEILQIKIDDVLHKQDLLESILTRKSRHWKYEKEWRIFCNNGGNRLYQYNHQALTGVYLGYKMSPEDKRVIRSVLGNMIPFTMMLDSDKFKLQPALVRSLD